MFAVLVFYRYERGRSNELGDYIGPSIFFNSLYKRRGKGLEIVDRDHLETDTQGARNLTQRGFY